MRALPTPSLLGRPFGLHHIPPCLSSAQFRELRRVDEAGSGGLGPSARGSHFVRAELRAAGLLTLRGDRLHLTQAGRAAVAGGAR